jgi:hypothetical protein
MRSAQGKRKWKMRGRRRREDMGREEDLEVAGHEESSDGG